MAIIDKKGVLHGSVSNIVYRPYRDQQVVQIKPSKVKRTLASKEAGLEFGLCCSTARAIRELFVFAFNGCDGQMINRLNSVVRKCISASGKPRGERDIHDGDLSFIQGFQFNKNSPLTAVLKERPKAELNSDGKVVLHLPSITTGTISSPSASEYKVKVLVLAVDFRKELFRVAASREIKISSQEPLAAGPMLFEEELPKGRLVAVSMSIFAYVRDGFGGFNSINSQGWSPAEVLAVWQLPDETSTESFSVSEPSTPSADYELNYEGNNSLKKIAILREKAPDKSVPEILP